MIVAANYIRIYVNPNIDGDFLPKSWKSDFSEKKNTKRNLECTFFEPRTLFKAFPQSVVLGIKRSN